MNPYQVLGVAPTANMEEIEAAYRREVRAHHPDLHQGESSEQLAAAEAATRSLNEAMALVRAGWRPLPGTASGFHYDDHGWGASPDASRSAPSGDDGWNAAFRTPPDTDWFGNPLGPRRAASVDCPICGKVFTDPTGFRHHLSRSHRIDDGVGKPPKPARDRLRWLTWIPAPAFWLFVLLVAYWAAAVAVLPTPIDIVAIWIGVVAFGWLLTRAMRDRHTW